MLGTAVCAGVTDRVITGTDPQGAHVSVPCKVDGTAESTLYKAHCYILTVVTKVGGTLFIRRSCDLEVLGTLLQITLLV